SGQEVQRVSVITDLPNLLRDNNAECMRRVVPKVREVLHVANIDMQLAAATAFLQILEKKLVTVEEYKKTFLQTILTSVDNKNEEVANAWLETLLSCIDLLPKDVVEKDILHGENYVLSIAVNKGQLCQTLQARLSCCKILGKVSSKFEHFVVKNDVLPVVLSLCGDVEYDVRACMCQRLDVIARGLGLELTKSKLLPQLIELSEDESQNVVCACLETTANIIGMLDREATVNAIVPMVKELLDKAMKNVNASLPVASRLFGRLCHSLLEYMSVDDKAYFLDYFRKLCRTGLSEKRSKDEAIKLLDALDIFETSTDASTETRQNAAYNFPAMVLFTEPKLFRLELYPCFSQLCKDPHLAVRKTVAMGFHEVAKVLGSNVGLVFPELNSLLMDPDIEILKAVVPNFKEIMSPLSAIGVDQFTEHRVHVVQEVVSHFLKTESIIFSSPCWRTQEAMMRSMESLYLLCTNDYIYNKVIPLLLEKLKTGRARLVKVAAAKTLTVLTRHLRYRGQRDEVVQTLIDEFHRSDSCFRRSLFIDLAFCYLQINSKQAFKDNFFDYILNMKSDRVATVRLKMLTIFPEMKRSLKLPRDQTLRTALDTVLRQIIVYDKDTDVQRAAQQMSEELAMIHEGSDNTRSNRRILTEEEEEDLKRENEERDIFVKEDQDRKEDESKAIKDKRNSISGNKKDAQSKIPSSKKTGSGPLKVLPGGGSKGDGLHQLVTKKTSVSSVTPVSVTNKASVTSLTAGAVNKKSPVTGRKSQPNTPSALQSPVAAVSSSRRGSMSNLSTSAAKQGSTSGATSETVKVKTITPTKTGSPAVGTSTRLPKKPGK
ncbi:unnamed protein product, partial [Candidula unifasciata]